MNKKELGKNLRDRRKFLNISQKELADITVIGLRSLVDIENGKGNPSLDNLNKIIDALGLEILVRVK